MIPTETRNFPRAIEGGQLVVEYATVCFRSQEDCGPIRPWRSWVQHVTTRSGSEAPPELGSSEIDATKETLMTDDRRTQTRDDESARDLSRRDFVAAVGFLTNFGQDSRGLL